MDELTQLCCETTQMLSKARKRARQLTVGKDATILYGKYKGRLGQCTGVTINDWDNRLVFLVQPYRLKGKGSGVDLLNDEEARTFRSLEELKFEQE